MTTVAKAPTAAQAWTFAPSPSRPLPDVSLPSLPAPYVSPHLAVPLLLPAGVPRPSPSTPARPPPLTHAAATQPTYPTSPSTTHPIPPTSATSDGVIGAAELSSIKALIGVWEDNDLRRGLQAKLAAHQEAVALRQVRADLAKKSASADPALRLSGLRCQVAQVHDLMAKCKANAAAAAKGRLAQYASRELVLQQTIAKAREDLTQFLSQRDVEEARHLAVAQREVETLQFRLAAAQAEESAAEQEIAAADAARIASAAASTDHPTSIPPFVAPSPTPTVIQPLVVPPALTIHADTEVRDRLLHARMVVDNFQQQDSDLPLNLAALRLTAGECATLVGQEVWTAHYGGDTPSAMDSVPRRVIGVMGAALRQLEVDLAAQSAAAAMAQAALSGAAAGAPHEAKSTVVRSKRSAATAELGEGDKNSTQDSAGTAAVTTSTPLSSITVDTPTDGHQCDNSAAGASSA